MDLSWEQTGVGKAIGEALIRLLSGRSIEQITVKDICAEAHVNRTTFYNYFDNKEQLLDAVRIASTEVFISRFQEHLDQLEKKASLLKPEQYLISSDVLEYYLSLVKEYRDVFRAFAMNQGTFYSKEQYQLMVEDIVLPVLRTHGINDERLADYMASFYFGAIHSLVLSWIEHDCEDEIGYVAKIIRECLHIPEEYYRH